MQISDAVNDMDRQWVGGASQVTRVVLGTLTGLAVAGCGGGGGGVQQAAEAGTATVAEVHSGLLDQGPQAVKAFTADIDDSGRVMVVYTQTVGDRRLLQAVLGEPGAAGGQPSFSAPVVIDAAAPHDGTASEFNVAMSPRGHALASWVQTAPCSADSYRTSGDCRFVVASRRLAGQSWEPAVRVGDNPAPLPKAIINDNGDVAMMWTAWHRGDSGALTQANGVVVMPAADSRFAAPWIFDDIQLPDGGFVGMALDRAGHLAYVTATAPVDGQRQLVARRGSIAGGFGATERLASGGDDIAIVSVSGGLNGQLVVLWQQASGGAVHRFAAAVDAPGQAWQLTDLGLPGAGQRSLTALGDGGNFLQYDLDACRALRRQGGVWQAATALPPGLCQASPSFTAAISRTGDVVGGLFSETQTAGNTGQWLAYSAARHQLTQPLGNQPADLLLGTRSTLGGELLLAENGIAALVSVNNYDRLPNTAAPAGSIGTAANLWLTYLRLP